MFHNYQQAEKAGWRFDNIGQAWRKGSMDTKDATITHASGEFTIETIEHYKRSIIKSYLHKCRSSLQAMNWVESSFFSA